VAVLINPRAGWFARHHGELELLRQLARAHAVRLSEPRSSLELSAEVRALSRESVARLVVCGGDGTHSRVFSALAASGVERFPELVLPRFGTVGTIARRWSPCRSPLGLVEGALAGRSGKLAMRSTLRVRLRGEESEVLGCTVGAGLVSRFFEVYARAERRGAGTALGMFARTFAESFLGGRAARELLEPRPLRLTIDGQLLDCSAFNLVVCSVFRDVGLGIRVTYRAPDPAPPLHLVASSLSASRLGRQGLRVFRGVPLRGRGIVDRLCQGFSVDFVPRDTLVIDGEMYSVEGAEVNAGPPLPIWSPVNP